MLAESVLSRLTQLFDVDGIATEDVFENLNAQFGRKTKERRVEGILATPVFESVVRKLDWQNDVLLWYVPG